MEARLLHCPLMMWLEEIDQSCFFLKNGVMFAIIIGMTMYCLDVMVRRAFTVVGIGMIVIAENQPEDNKRVALSKGVIKMDLNEVVAILRGRPFYLSSLHDFEQKEDSIERIGMFEEDMHNLRYLISEEWLFNFRKKNEDNGFYVFDIIRSE